MKNLKKSIAALEIAIITFLSKGTAMEELYGAEPPIDLNPGSSPIDTHYVALYGVPSPEAKIFIDTAVKETPIFIDTVLKIAKWPLIVITFIVGIISLIKIRKVEDKSQKKKKIKRTIIIISILVVLIVSSLLLPLLLKK